MASQTVPFVTAEDYLEAERKAAWKSEYYEGQVYKMAGARSRHTRIATNLTARLLLALDGGPCQVFNSDMRVHATGIYTYPGVSVVCGDPVFVQSDNLTNPILVVEVLSKSTKRYDRTEKFLHYQSLASLKEYLLVSHDPRSITHCTRLGTEDWRIETVDQARGSIVFACIGVEIGFDHLYAGVNSLPR